MTRFLFHSRFFVSTSRREHETPRDVAQKFDLASGFQLVQANWTAGMWSALELSQFSRLVFNTLDNLPVQPEVKYYFKVFPHRHQRGLL